MRFGFAVAAPAARILDANGGRRKAAPQKSAVRHGGDFVRNAAIARRHCRNDAHMPTSVSMRGGQTARDARQSNSEQGSRQTDVALALIPGGVGSGLAPASSQRKHKRGLHEQDRSPSL